MRSIEVILQALSSLRAILLYQVAQCVAFRACHAFNRIDHCYWLGAIISIHTGFTRLADVSLTVYRVPYNVQSSEKTTLRKW